MRIIFGRSEVALESEVFGKKKAKLISQTSWA